MEQKVVQKLINSSIVWFIFWILSILGLLIPGILLNMLALIWPCLGFVYPICISIYRIWKLVNIKKYSAQSSAPGLRNNKVNPIEMSSLPFFVLKL
jgi:hypothetical protein